MRARLSSLEDYPTRWALLYSQFPKYYTSVTSIYGLCKPSDIKITTDNHIFYICLAKLIIFLRDTFIPLIFELDMLSLREKIVRIFISP